jgi:hypothetical protein
MVSVACFDLFHSTAGILTACELDATTDGCTDAEPDAAADFCSWTPAEARAHAEHACAWLGACETPMGKNAFGSCEFAALLAYDCAANPNHRVRGEMHALWDCLQGAQSCADVDRCVFPAVKVQCSSAADYTACVQEGANGVRIECEDGGTMPYPNAHGESCALWGQTCGSYGGTAQCAGSASNGSAPCSVEGCSSGAALHWCDPKTGADIGIDCNGNGAQACAGFPRDAASVEWVSCVAESEAGSCTPDASAGCAGGVAYSCPSGVVEQIDCNALLQADGCAPGPLGPPFDWTSACVAVPGTCTADYCSEAGVVGCARGTTFTVDCTAVGLRPCRMVATDMGSEVHAACAPP